ncbi:MAG: signal peptide peptidase SppA [Bacteroidota bacterium]
MADFTLKTIYMESKGTNPNYKGAPVNKKPGFFKYVFATVLGLFLFYGLGTLFVIILAAVAGSSGKTEISDNSVLKLELDGPIAERSKENPLSKLHIPMQGESATGLVEILKALRSAKTDPKIKGLYLQTSGLKSGISTVDEIRSAIVDFKTSGKFVIAYSETMSEGAYYLCSTADSIWLNPVGDIEFNGLTSTTPFLKGTFAKLGIKPEIFRVGEFKSAVEPFFLDKMSPASREQTTSFMNSIYNHMLANIAVSRKVTPEYLKAVSDSMKVQNPQDALKYKLITNVGYYDEVLALLRKKLGIKADEKIKFVSQEKYLGSIKDEDVKVDSRIAVIIASGEIQGAEADEDNIGSDEIAEQIRKARLDKNVKAIVLRVNSPGGSALASDVMWREVRLCSEDKEHKKPIIASMSDLAASGGYYISMGCDSIVAEPTTITGSIGVFGLMFNTQELFNDKLGVTFDNVSTGYFSDLGSGTRPMKEYERKVIQGSVNQIYADFTSKAAAGRHMDVEALRKIASGRVWSGIEAKERGLVDKLGGMDVALAMAARMAKLEQGKYSLKYMPEQKDFFERLVSSLNDDAETKALKANFGQLAPLVKELKTLNNMNGKVQARLPMQVDFK